MKKIRRRELAGAIVSGAAALGAERPTPKSAAWKIDDLEDQRKASGKPWLQFFDAPTMYLGVYSLGAAATDGQPAHREDEIYYVVSGRAMFRAGDEEMAVEKGSVLFVKAGVPHKFSSIEEPIKLLVFFSKAKT